MNARLRNARKRLGLSQEYVARQMCLSRPTISAIESGQRKVTAEELARFSQIYGVTIEELSDTDKREVMNLIDFKRRYKNSR